MSLSFVKAGAVAAAVIVAGLAVSTAVAEAKPLTGTVQYTVKVKNKPFGFTTDLAKGGQHVLIIDYWDNGTKKKFDDWVHVLRKGDYNGWVPADAVDIDYYKPFPGPGPKPFPGPKPGPGFGFCFNGPYGYFCANN